MTPHDHITIVPGCYRCELNEDEARDALAEQAAMRAVNQDRPPNFREDGRLYLVRCFACVPERGRENYALAVPSGECAWCGWYEDDSGPLGQEERPANRGVSG